MILQTLPRLLQHPSDLHRCLLIGQKHIGINRAEIVAKTVNQFPLSCYEHVDLAVLLETDRHHLFPDADSEIRMSVVVFLEKACPEPIPGFQPVLYECNSFFYFQWRI